MPTHKKMGHRRKMRGRGFWDWVKKAHNWIKDKKIISTLARAVGAAGVPYASQIGNVASSLGYGRGRSGYGLRLAGGRR